MALSEKAQAFQTEDESGIDIREWTFKILSYWKWIIVSVISAMVMVFIYHRYTVPQYLVNASMLINEESKSMGQQLMEEVDLFSAKVNLENEMAVIKSRSFIAEVIDSLNFEVEYYREGRIKSTELYGEDSPFKVTVVDNSGKQNFQLKLVFINEDEFRLFTMDGGPFQGFDGTYHFPAVITGEGLVLRINRKNKALPSEKEFVFKLYDVWGLAESYQKQLQVGTLNKDASILTLSYISSNTIKAQDFLNAVIHFYIKRELEEKNQAAVRTIAFIDQQLRSIQDSLSIIEDSLQDFRTRNSIVDLSQKGEVVLQEIQELETQRSNEEVKMSYFNYLMEYLKENRNPTSVVSPATVGVDNPILVALINNLNELTGQLSQTEINATEVNPQVKALRLQVSRIMEGVVENVQNLKGNTQITINNLNARIRETEAKINQLPKTERTYIGIQRHFNLSENLFIYLQEKKAEAGIAKASTVSKASVIDPAIKQSQTSPRKMRNLAIALLLGLCVPIGFVVLKDYLNDKIQSLEDIEKRTSLPVLGVIGYSHYSSELVMEQHPRSFIAETFRKVRSSMKFLENGKASEVIMITSFLSGDGKTFSSVNIAIMMAKMGKKTLLLGLDLRRQKLHNVFNVSNQLGMSNLLNGESSWGEVVQKTNIDNLDIITGGDVPPNPNELISGDRFGMVIAALKKEYDAIVIDTPPVGLVSDAIEIAKQSDICLYIMRHNYTFFKAIEHINELSEKQLIHKVGLVLNGVDFENVQNRYTYNNYGYSYGKKKGYYEG